MECKIRFGYNINSVIIKMDHTGELPRPPYGKILAFGMFSTNLRSYHLLGR